MFGGKLIKGSRKEVPGTYKQCSYSDEWQDSIDIEYDGDLNDPSVKAAIIAAFQKSSMFIKGGSSAGALRWPLQDSVAWIDAVNKKLIINAGCGLCD